MAESVTSVSTNRNLQCEVDSFHFLSARSCVVILTLLRHQETSRDGKRHREKLLRRQPGCANFTQVIFSGFETPSRPCATASKQTMQNVVMAPVQFSRQHWKKVCGPLRKPTSDLFKTFNRSKNSFGEIHPSRAWLGVSRSVPLKPKRFHYWLLVTACKLSLGNVYQVQCNSF